MRFMPEPTDSDLEIRVRVLERENSEIRERLAVIGADVTAARMLAAGADHDVSEVRAELRAHTQALNALREDQLDTRAELRAHREETRQGFATVYAGMAQITELLGRISDG